MSRPSRIQALQVAKRYASAIGLKAAKIALIDQLFAFSKAIDWSDAEIIPLVWPSNEVLARRLGIKVSTLKYHLAGLVEAGLICYSDHPTYQRRGRRSEGRPYCGSVWYQLIPNCRSLL
ncbi:helix-turn-helix domain-containing protein [Rhizobium beringeri]